MSPIGFHKNPISEIKGMQEKECIMGVRDRWKKIRPFGSQSQISRQLVMPDSNPRD